MPDAVDCLVEIGSKRAFACSADWPGWCRSGRSEEAALAALLAYGDRYAAVLRTGRRRLSPPRNAEELRVLERATGNATTDFGAPDAAFDLDASDLDATSWRRSRAALVACWAAFDDAVSAARGIELTKGPRGGGRDLDAIVDHVVGAESSYLRMLVGSGTAAAGDGASSALEDGRVAVLEGLARARAGEVPERGPRGGARWKPRRFLRRAAWHVLDHAWEIEDRAEG